jgi:hypothetical protein
MLPEFTKGGRGKAAPYETTHVRIPIKLKEHILHLSDAYKIAVQNSAESEFDLKLNQALQNILDKPVNNNVIVELAKEVVQLRKRKKATKQALENLLTAILGDDYEIE